MAIQDGRLWSSIERILPHHFSMDLLNRDIRYYLLVHPFYGQSGGGGTITIDSYKIKYRKALNEGTKTLFIYAGRDAGQRPCLVLSINGIEAILQSLERGNDCFVDISLNSKNLVLAAIKLAKKFGAKKLSLTDNSFIQCPDKVYLANLSFLSIGRTWYESIAPFKPEQDIEKYRISVQQNKWTDILAVAKARGFALDIDTGTINTKEVGSAMKVIANIKENKTACLFFSKMMGELLLWSGIPSLYGTSWTLEI
jgi:hypothetical protein